MDSFCRCNTQLIVDILKPPSQRNVQYISASLPTIHSYSPKYMLKIPISVFGATGMVGQRMLSLLDAHPLFEIVTLCASPRSVGKRYEDACQWRLETPCPSIFTDMVVQECTPTSLPKECRLVLSALDSSVAGEIEQDLAEHGIFVVSNASNHRMNPVVPLIIPEVNPNDLHLLTKQPWSGGILTNPNCCAIPLALSLAPLRQFGSIQGCMVSTWQAVSGAGYPGESAWDMIGSVHPHPGNEEEKLAIEPCKILGESFPISARCVRVPVADGHLLSVQVHLEHTPTPEEAKSAWNSWNQSLSTLPSSPRPLFHINTRRDRPSSRFDVQRGNGMALSIGRVEPCPIMGLKYFVLSHNTIRGAAGAAIANAELLAQHGFLTRGKTA